MDQKSSYLEVYCALFSYSKCQMFLPCPTPNHLLLLRNCTIIKWQAIVNKKKQMHPHIKSALLTIPWKHCLLLENKSLITQTSSNLHETKGGRKQYQRTAGEKTAGSGRRRLPRQKYCLCKHSHPHIYNCFCPMNYNNLWPICLQTQSLPLQSDRNEVSKML